MGQKKSFRTASIALYNTYITLLQPGGYGGFQPDILLFFRSLVN